MLDFDVVVELILDSKVEELRALLIREGEVNQTTKNDKWNLLHLATKPLTVPVAVELLDMLVKLGVDCNAIDRNGYRPLHYAARKKDLAAIDCLLKAGANPNVLNRLGESPLHLALSEFPYNGEVVRALLESGADPDIGGEEDSPRAYLEENDDDDAKIIAIIDEYKKL